MKKKKIQLIKNIVYYFAIIVLVFVCLITTASFFEIPGGYRLFMVESGSMEPALKTASIILTKKADAYNIGDIIAFNTPSVVTHRIFGFKDSPEKGKLIITKGDANDTPDPEHVKKEQIIGKVVFNLPYLGHPVKFAKTEVGFISLIIIPGTLIIYGEVINIKNEIIKFIKEKKKKKTKNLKKEKDKKSKNLLILFVFSFSFFNYFLPTKAYYNDLATSKNNVISAGVWGSAPTIKSGDIVINEVYYDVDSAHGDDGNVPTSDEWIELYNNLDREVSLLNWTISDNTHTRTINVDKKIPAKGFAVIALDAQTWSYWPLIPASAIKIELGTVIGGGLANNGDRVILRNNNGIEIDAVSWGTDIHAFNPSVVGVAEGHSISRITKGVDTNTALDWMDTFTGSTPPGPNPGTNPHNPDGSLCTPMPTSTPEPISTPIPTPLVEPTPTVEPIPTTEPTLTPEPIPTIEPSMISEPTPISEPTVIPEEIIIETNQDV